MQVKPENNNPDLDLDVQLSLRVQAGDFDALETLYERYSRQAFGLALKILNSNEAAEDAVQEAFLRFWKNPNSYDQQRGRFVSWLLSVVHNLCIDQLRRKKHVTVSLDWQEEQNPVNEVPDQAMPLEEEVWLGMQRDVIRQALTRLPREQRYVIELAFFKGLTHQEIASQTGQPLGTIKSRIRQGLRKLKELVQDL